MEEKMLLYSLLLTSIFNLVILFVLAVAIVRLGGVMQKLSSRVNDFLAKGEKEISMVGASLRGTLSKSDQYVNAAVKISERYMIYKAINKFSASPKSSRMLMALGVGYGLLNTLANANQSKRKDA